MDKTLRAIALYLAWLLATTPCFPQQIMLQIMQPAPSTGTAACGSSITGVLADYWAGSVSASPVPSWSDSSANANTLTGVASPTWTNNKFGTGLAGTTTNGSTQYFTTTSRIPTSSFGNLSMYFVVSFSACGKALTGSSTSGSSLNGSLVFQVNGTCHLELDKQNLVALCTSGTSLSSGTTYELYADYNGTTCHLYINGTLNTTTTNAQTIPAGIDRLMTEWDSGSPLSPWIGSVYEAIFSSSTSYQSGAHTCWTALGLP